MKQFLIFVGVLVAIAASGFLFSTAFAAPFPYAVGGTGSSTVPTLGQVFYAGVTGWQSRATTTVTCAGTDSCNPFVVFGSSPVTITGSGGGGGAFPFTPTLNYGALTNATGTPIWFQAGLQASSTSFIQRAVIGSTTITEASTTNFAITGALAANCNGTSALTTTSSGTVNCTAQPQGTVTAVSVATANGFAGSSGGGATPILTLTTTVTGLLLGNGTAASAYGGTSCTYGVLSLNASGSATCGGFAFPFTPTLNFGVTVNSTSTPIWFTKGLMASTTSYLSSTFHASSTAPQVFLDDLSSNFWSLRNIAGNLYIGTSTQAAPNATTTNQSALSISKGGQLYTQEVNSATTTTMFIDWLTTPNQVDVQVLASAMTIGFNNASTTGMTKRVYICNGGSAAGTVTFAAAVNWPSGTAPTHTATAGHCDLYSFNTSQATSTSTASPALFGAQTAF